MKLLLTSAGLTNNEIAKALEDLVNKPFTEMSILFVTTAANTSTEDKSWLTDNIFEVTSRKPKSFDLIDIAGLPQDLWQKHFNEADAVFIGGGDEAYLSRIFKEQDVKEYLQNSFSEKVYVGISAGSIVAGIFLPTGLNVELYGEECESESGTGMNFCDFAYIPHLNSPYFPRVTTQILEGLIDRFESNAIATDDFTAIKIEDGKFTIIGEGSRWENPKKF
jgi:dipeptidase E